MVSSPEHSDPHADVAAEDLIEPQEGDVGKPPFARVLDNIRTLNKLQVPVPKQVKEAYSTIEVEQGAVPKPSVPVSLPVAPLLAESWSKFEEMVAGAGSSLSQRKIQTPSPCSSETSGSMVRVLGLVRPSNQTLPSGIL